MYTLFVLLERWRVVPNIARMFDNIGYMHHVENEQIKCTSLTPVSRSFGFSYEKLAQTRVNIRTLLPNLTYCGGLPIEMLVFRPARYS